MKTSFNINRGRTKWSRKLLLRSGAKKHYHNAEHARQCDWPEHLEMLPKLDKQRLVNGNTHYRWTGDNILLGDYCRR